MSASHLRAVFSDPGIVPLPKANLDFSDMHSGQKQKDKVRQPKNKDKVRQPKNKDKVRQPKNKLFFK